MKANKFVNLHFGKKEKTGELTIYIAQKKKDKTKERECKYLEVSDGQLTVTVHSNTHLERKK